MIHVAVLQSAMIFRYISGYARQFVIMIQKPATSVVSRMGRRRCTPRGLPFVSSSADQANGAASCKIEGLVEIPPAEI
jgi:hypothetical protein